MGELVPLILVKFIIFEEILIQGLHRTTIALANYLEETFLAG